MPYKKRLEGICRTEGWKDLLKEAEAKCHRQGNTGSDGFDVDNDDDGTSLLPLARKTLCDYLQQQQLASSCDFLPIRVVLSLAVILGQEPVAKLLDCEEELCETSSTAARTRTTTTLAFTPELKEVALTDEQKRFRKRLERLSLKQEEERYGKLTNNLGLSVPQDDVTTRTMTYAASVGLNMIVAPLSFGCFMYFFSGPVLDYLWPVALPPGGTTDIRRVIIGVLSGCGMLFVEMLLFVIRTHELDRAVRTKSKQKKNRSGPFGYYTSNTAKTFKED